MWSSGSDSARRVVAFMSVTLEAIVVSDARAIAHRTL
jgi:hypothetical protein